MYAVWAAVAEREGAVMSDYTDYIDKAGHLHGVRGHLGKWWHVCYTGASLRFSSPKLEKQDAITALDDMAKRYRWRVAESEE